MSGRSEAEREFTVYFFDTDAGGVVHNLTYLRWIEAVRTDLAEILGWGIEEMVAGEHGCPVLTKTEVEYLRPAKLGERVRVISRLGEVGKVRFMVESEVRGAEGQVFCLIAKCPSAITSCIPTKMRSVETEDNTPK